MEEKKEKKLYKKWWFWIVLLIALLIVGFVTIMVVALIVATEGINKVALEVQNIDNQATVYTSAGENIIVIELSNDSKNIREQVEKKIQKYATNGDILSNYSELIIYIPTDIDNNHLLVKNVYALPTLIQKSDKEKIFMDYVQATETSKSKESTTSIINTEDRGEDIVLTAGKYTVGVDIKEGKYDAIAQEGSGNFFVSGSTKVVEILAVEAEIKKEYGYIDKYNNLNLKKGDTVELRSNLRVLLQAK